MDDICWFHNFKKIHEWAGDKKIGVSIMKIEEKLDRGPILSSEELKLDQNATHGEIEKKLSANWWLINHGRKIFSKYRITII